MSDHSSHGHGHHAPDHTPHVTPLKVYLATWGALMVLTAITVGASYVNFGGANLVIALVIATIKAGVVAAMFMHLLHDHKFHALVLVSGGLFLLIFVAFTMFDTEYRGRADNVEAERPADVTRPFEGTKALAALQKKWSGAHPAASTPPAGPGGVTAGHDMPAAPASAAPATSASVEPATSASVEPAVSASASVAPSASVPVPASASASAAPAESAHPH